VVNQSEYPEHSLVSWLRAERDVHGLSRRLYSQKSVGGVSVALLYSRSRPGVIGGAGTRLVAIYFWSNSVSGNKQTPTKGSLPKDILSIVARMSL